MVERSLPATLLARQLGLEELKGIVEVQAHDIQGLMGELIFPALGDLICLDRRTDMSLFNQQQRAEDRQIKVNAQGYADRGLSLRGIFNLEYLQRPRGITTRKLWGLTKKGWIAGTMGVGEQLEPFDQYCTSLSLHEATVEAVLAEFEPASVLDTLAVAMVKVAHSYKVKATRASAVSDYLYYVNTTVMRIMRPG